MTWNDWLNQASILIPRNDAVAILLACFYSEADPSWLVLHGDEAISEIDLEDIIQPANDCVQLRQKGTPLAYVLGETYFYGRKFWLGPPGAQVLIPRPETEIIVDAVKKMHPQNILDVGTGSGCIAITLKLELPDVEVAACDISEDALYAARENAKALGAKIKFIKSDLLNNITDDYDVVVANLPYVDESWDWIDKDALSHEPSIALYAEDGGLALIKKLIEQSVGRTKYLILEADPCQHERIVEFADNHNYRLLETRGFCLVLTK